jgi:thioredoxin reductase (NADPH)
MNTHYDVVVIGGGPAGYSAALYAARAGLSTLVLEKLSPGGQMATTTLIENYPGIEQADGFELAETMQRCAEQCGAQSEFAEVTAVTLSEQPKRIETTSGAVTAGTVILATGAEPRPLGLPDEDKLRSRGVSYCATCDGMFYRGKTVAVVGGGNTAIGDARTLAKLCAKVYLIHRRDTLRASQREQESLLALDNVEILWNTVPEALEQDGRLSGLTVRDVTTGAVRTLDVDGVFVAVGRVPETALFAGQVALDEAGYVVAGEDTRTSVPGVFAAGDLRTKPLRQVVTACADGAVAAQAAADFLAQ